MLKDPQRLCRYLIHQKILTPQKAEEMLRIYFKQKGLPPLTTLLLQHGLISESQYTLLEKMVHSSGEETRQQTAGPKRGEDSLDLVGGNYQKYQILKELGRGGMGRVLLAYDRTLKRKTALKICSHADRDRLLRFVKEAQIESQLEHHNIAPVYDAGKTSQGEMYFAMRYIEGASLAEMLHPPNGKFFDSGVPFPLRRRLTIFCKVLEGMAYAHSMGIIHRDIKPQNIMVGQYGEVLVVDWGVAKVLSERKRPEITFPTEGDQISERLQTLVGSVVGTPGYMSPEQALGEVEKLSIPSDIYSLGVVLYEILTKTPPFSGTEVMDVLMKTIRHDFLPPSQVAVEESPVSRALEQVVLKAMAPDPSHRYPSAEKMLQDVQAYLDDEPLSVYNPPGFERIGKFIRRHSTLLAAALLVLLITCFFTYLLARESQKKLVEEQKKLALTEKQKRLMKEKRDAMKTLLDLKERQKEFMDKLVQAYGPYRLARSHMVRNLRYSTIQEVVIPKLKEALKIQPKFIEARLQLIKIYFYQMKLQEALGEFVKLIGELPPKESKKYGTLMTQLLFRLQMPSTTALKLPKDFYFSKPDFLSSQEWKTLKALMLMMIGQWSESAKLVDQLLKMPGGATWETYLLKSLLAISLKKWENAEDLLRKQVKAYPDIPIFYHHLSTVLKYRNKLKEAHRYRRKLMDLDPSYYYIWFEMAGEGWLQWRKHLRKEKKASAMASALAVLRYSEQSLHWEPGFKSPKIYREKMIQWFLKTWRLKKPGEIYSAKVFQSLRHSSLHSKNLPLQKEFALYALDLRAKRPTEEVRSLIKPHLHQIKSYLEAFQEASPDSLDLPWIEKRLKELREDVD